MKRYNQYCPIVRASEIVAVRWMPVILRNILLGCSTFTQIERGAPGIPKSLLTQRLKELQRFGIITRHENPAGRGWIYEATEAGKDFWNVCEALGTWGARWLEVAPSTSTRTWSCGRCATASIPTRYRSDARSCASTSPTWSEEPLLDAARERHRRGVPEAAR